VKIGVIFWVTMIVLATAYAFGFFDTAECPAAPDNYRRAAAIAEDFARERRERGDVLTAIEFEATARHDRRVADDIDDLRDRAGCD
jgi:hypothetical protein